MLPVYSDHSVNEKSWPLLAVYSPIKIDYGAVLMNKCGNNEGVIWDYMKAALTKKDILSWIVKSS